MEINLSEEIERIKEALSSVRNKYRETFNFYSDSALKARG